MKPLLTIIVSVFVIFNQAYAEENLFEVAPSVNENVETTINALINSAIPEFTKAKVELKRNADDVVVDEIQKGQLAGHFTSSLPLGTDETDFIFAFSIDMEESLSRKNQYAISMRANGKVTEVDQFKQYLLQRMKTHCSNGNSNSQACSVVNQLSGSTTAKSSPEEILVAWKTTLLEKVASSKDAKVAPIKDDLVDYLEQKIQISKDANGNTHFTMETSDLRETFKERAPELFNDARVKLAMDFALESLDIIFEGDEMKMSFHIVKYHVIDSIKFMMTGVSAYQPLLEDEQNGINFGKAARATFTGTLK